MRRAIRAVVPGLMLFMAGGALAQSSPPTDAEMKELYAEIREVRRSQEQILRVLAEIKEELRIIKVRTSRP